VSIDNLADAIARTYAEHSHPLSLDELTSIAVAVETRHSRVPSSRRGIAIALVSFAAVLALGAGLLLVGVGLGPDDNAVNPTEPSTTAPTTTAPPNTTTSVPTTTAPPQLVYPDHEVTLIETPPVIQAIPSGPPPAFETSGLGVEVSLIPFETLTLDQLALEENEFSLADQPIIALGDRDGLLAFRIPVIMSGEVVTCDWGVGWTKWNIESGQPAPLGTCSGGNTTPPGGGIQAEPDVTVRMRQSHPWITQVFWSSLPSDVSVVQITVNGTRQWQRPIGGVAVFIVQTASEPTIELVSYDDAGRELDNRTAEPG